MAGGDFFHRPTDLNEGLAPWEKDAIDALKAQSYTPLPEAERPKGDESVDLLSDVPSTIGRTVLDDLRDADQLTDGSA